MNAQQLASVLLVLAVAGLSGIGYVEGGLLYAIVYPVSVVSVTVLLNVVFIALE